jgi:DNA-binding transcriptional regulator YhcF (GntR family)
MITVDHASQVPPFEQIRLSVAGQIHSGQLPPGTRLPTVRQLATDLALAPNTVARAYRELESAGLVITAGRRGTVVAATGDAAQQEAARAAATFADVARRLGLDRAQALSLARAAIEATQPG